LAFRSGSLRDAPTAQRRVVTRDRRLRYVRAMKVTFVRSPGQRLRTIAERRDGVTVGVTGAPDRDGRLPHDLAHFVVEKELGLDSGFWGGIAQGRLFRGAEIVSPSVAQAFDVSSADADPTGPRDRGRGPSEDLRRDLD